MFIFPFPYQNQERDPGSSLGKLVGFMEVKPKKMYRSPKTAALTSYALRLVHTQAQQFMKVTV